MQYKFLGAINILSVRDDHDKLEVYLSVHQSCVIRGRNILPQTVYTSSGSGRALAPGAFDAPFHCRHARQPDRCRARGPGQSSWHGIMRPHIIPGAIGRDAKLIGAAFLTLHANFRQGMVPSSSRAGAESGQCKGHGRSKSRRRCLIRRSPNNEVLLKNQSRSAQLSILKFDRPQCPGHSYCVIWGERNGPERIPHAITSHLAHFQCH